MTGSTSIPIESMAEWLSLQDGLLIVAGPCSVEGHHQLAATARGLAATGKVSVLRAGVWKPRSRPGQFEGCGAEALAWLTDIREETGMPVAVEVARPGHAELCLKHRIDMIWLGARTTVNPFMVQEIANAIRGTGIPVMIKNPVCPDLPLWIGAIERIFLAGTQKLIAIHRGFQTHVKIRYRNIPLWDIPMALKKELPQLPVLCDPSHIAGNESLLLEVSLKAMMLKMDGLMIEVHHQPGKALTDPIQQINPGRFDQIMKQLDPLKSDSNATKALQALREQIDEHDHQVLNMLAKRLSLSEEIGKLKKEHGQGIVQPSRQKDLFEDRQKQGETLGLRPGFVETLLRLLHDESVSVQSKHRKGNDGIKG